METDRITGDLKSLTFSAGSEEPEDRGEIADYFFAEWTSGATLTPAAGSRILENWFNSSQYALIARAISSRLSTDTGFTRKERAPSR